jgi:addiction module RelB/DinJ family antitoxin
MKTLLNIKTDKEVKLGAQLAAGELGLPLGTIINAFLRQLARDKEVSFSVPYKPTPYLVRVLAEAEREWKAGKVAGPFATVADLRKSLES